MSQSQRQARIPVYKKIIQDKIKEWMIKEFLNYRLSKQGYVDSDVLKTPLGTRIIIYAERPNWIIGRKGVIVKELTDLLSKKLGVDNPIIDVTPIQSPELNPKIIANRIAWAMTKGVKFRRAGMIAIRQIMDGGAKGAEITISGKLTSERSRFEKYVYGIVYKNGYDSRLSETWPEYLPMPTIFPSSFSSTTPSSTTSRSTPQRTYLALTTATEPCPEAL